MRDVEFVNSDRVREEARREADKSDKGQYVLNNQFKNISAKKDSC